MKLPRLKLPRTAQDWAALAPLFVLAALIGLLAWIYAPVFHGEVAGDDNTFHFADTARLRECLAHHDFDLWNPMSNNGFALGYYYQLVPSFLPAAGAWIFGGSVLWWFELGVFLPFVLAPAATYRGMRMMKATPWQAVGAAIAVAMLAGNSKWGGGSEGTFFVGLYTQGWALAIFPLALGHGVRWVDEGRGLGSAAFWGVAVGLCHPVAGVAIGLALAAGEVARWTVAPVQRLLGLPAEDEARPLPAFTRLAILGLLLVIGSAPAWLPVFVDYAGYGGFPHRVAGEEGWYLRDVKDAIAGHLLDEGRLGVITVLVPVVAIFGRARWLRLLWAAALAYFLVMIVGPYVPHGRDDPFPAVRVLGPLQVCLALAAGAGLVLLVAETRRYLAAARWEVWGREALGAVAGTLVFVLLYSGSQVIHGRVRVASDYPDFHREELDDLFTVMERQTQGRQQVRAGAEAHWSNLLPYVYAHRPAMLQMGGAALQSSPTYVYQWEQQDVLRSAYIYDAPYVLLKKDRESEVPGGTVIGETEHYELKMFDAPGLIVPVHVVDVLPAGRWPARDRGVKWIKGDQPMKDEVLAFAGFGGPGPAPQGIVIAYSWQPSPGDEPDYTAELEASAPTTFEIKVSWHPRWHGFLDGKPIELRRVTPDFLAVDVPPGRHHLALRFDRPAWAWLVWLLWPAVVIAGRRVTSKGRAAAA